MIIKNTVTYQDEGLVEYADLEMMQMLGRAGRPQFDTSAVAVILTRKEKGSKYKKLVAGEELLESCLHLNLIDHLNAEIGLGTVTNLETAKKWLSGTFLFVRLGKNPKHYKLDGDSGQGTLESRMDQICARDIGLLEDASMVKPGDELSCTAFGDAMARYYVKFETMKAVVGLPPAAKLSQMVRTFLCP